MHCFVYGNSHEHILGIVKSISWRASHYSNDVHERFGNNDLHRFKFNTWNDTNLSTKILILSGSYQLGFMGALYLFAHYGWADIYWGHAWRSIFLRVTNCFLELAKFAAASAKIRPSWNIRRDVLRDFTNFDQSTNGIFHFDNCIWDGVLYPIITGKITPKVLFSKYIM